MGKSTNTVLSTSRFSNRAENYAKFRPGYPDELFDFIEYTIKIQACPLSMIFSDLVYAFFLYSIRLAFETCDNRHCFE